MFSCWGINFNEITTKIGLLKKFCEVLLLLCLEDILKNFKCSLFCFLYNVEEKCYDCCVTYQCLTLHNDTATVCVIYIYKREVLMNRCGLIHDDKLFWREVVEEWFILLLMFRTPNFLVVLCSAVSNWFIHTSSECAVITQHMWPNKVWPSASLITKVWRGILPSHCSLTPTAQIHVSALKWF